MKYTVLKGQRFPILEPNNESSSGEADVYYDPEGRQFCFVISSPPALRGYVVILKESMIVKAKMQGVPVEEIERPDD